MNWKIILKMKLKKSLYLNNNFIHYLFNKDKNFYFIIIFIKLSFYYFFNF